MAYRTKEDCLREAKRLGLDVDGMSWPELQGAVAKAAELERLGAKSVEGPKMAENKKPKTPLEEAKEALRPYIGKTVMISPELAATTKRLAKYEEEIGDELEIEEKSYEVGRTNFNAGKDLVTGTFFVKGKTGRKTKAICSLPKENSGMIFRPGVDLVPVVTWQGKAGYLWTHGRLPNVKSLLFQSGYYEKYKDLFSATKHPENIWYAAGKQLVVNPNVVHSVFAEIEREEQRKRDRGE